MKRDSSGNPASLLIAVDSVTHLTVLVEIIETFLLLQKKPCSPLVSVRDLLHGENVVEEVPVNIDGIDKIHRTHSTAASELAVHALQSPC